MAGSKSQVVRIIGGKWRGRKLRFRANEGLRPTLGRTRETLFNWLRPHIGDCTCMDLFAGSGILGFEALSQGARQVTFVERHRATLQGIKAIAQDLNCEDRCQFFSRDARAVLRSGVHHDILFIDPPFAEPRLLTETLALLTEEHVQFQYAYVEIPAKLQIEAVAQEHGLSVNKLTNAGATTSALLTKQFSDGGGG